MPVEVDSPIHILSEQEFHALAHKVLGVVFDVHNSHGRLLNEDIYKKGIQHRCRAIGLVPTRREVRIKLSHRDYVKPLFMDLLVAESLMVEAKTVERLNTSHEAQALDYLLLTEMKHGLLINLRGSKVEKRYVSTSLDFVQRRQFEVNDDCWQVVNDESNRMHILLVELLQDWGAFLKLSLYREAMIHFFGGSDVALRQVAVIDQGTEIGMQETFMISDDTALAFTSLADGMNQMKTHLEKFISHSCLSHIQWVNLYRHEVRFITLRNSIYCTLGELS